MQPSFTEILVIIFASTLIILLLAIILVVSLNITRKRKRKLQQNILETRYKTREETIRHVSRDLHDEIGSSLSGINLFAQMAEQQLSENNLASTKQFLEKIKGYSETVIEQTGDLVWMLQPENDTQEKMLQRLKQFGESVSNAIGVIFKYETLKDLQLPENNLLYRRNIYLICKESINNAAKYSGASEISVCFYNTHVIITDNGKGFNKDVVSLGHGMRNMLQRSNEIKMELSIDSSPDTGTSITLRF